MEVEVGKLSAKARTTSRKRGVRALRREGLIPAVVYGGSSPEPELLSIDPLALRKSLDPEKKANTLISLTVESNGDASRTMQVMLKDYQLDPIKRTLVHADFIRISLEEVLEITVPLHLVGKSVGMQLGGKLNQVFRELEVECRPDKIPSELTADISALDLGDSLTIADIPVPEGVSIALPADQTIAIIVAPRAETAEEAGEELVEGEGEAVAAPAEGAESAS